MADEIEKTPIPDTPPSKSGATQGSMAGIAAIKRACIENEITSKYAICALLGIAGVESKWMFSSEENMKYSKDGLLNGPFKPMPLDEAEKWSNPQNKGYTAVQFFGWLHGTRKPGGVPADGNYFGRGFVQLTSKRNYKAIGAIIGKDLVNNPDIVTSDIELGAKIAVAFIKMNIKTWKEDQHKPGFFNQLIHVIKGDPKGWKLKRVYYEYFLGGKSAEEPTNKDAVKTTVNKTPHEIASSPASKKEAYTEDRTNNFNQDGFTDPDGKYPLRDFMNEPDTNRLARGITEGTHIKFKDSSRNVNIPTANGGFYDQPKSAYNTVYPMNKVFESESGHVLEFDDSPNGERINLYHQKGTFIEIDPNGSQINYIVGDGFYITEKNGNIFINGACNVTSSGPMNILCQGDANLEVNGQVDAVFHNHVNMGVAKDLNVAVGGDYNILVEGNYNVEIGKTSNTRAIGTMSLESTDALKLKTAKTMSMEGGDTASTAETLMKMSSSFKLETSSDFQIKAKTFTLDIAENTEIKTGTFKTQTLTGNIELKSKGNTILNSPDIISMTSKKIDLNGQKIKIEDIKGLSLLGESKKPVDFAGNELEDREKEQVLVDTKLNPIGPYNPNALPKTLIDSVLDGVPVIGDILSSFGGSIPNIYDPKYAGASIETKTSLSAASSASKHRLVVPPEDSARQYGQLNLVPPERHSSAEFKYETEDDWATAAGQKAAHNMTSTSDYENNIAGKLGESQESTQATGGLGDGNQLSDEKLNDINGKTDFPASYPLSKHFTLGMFVQSQGCILKDTILNRGKSESSGPESKPYSKQQLVANLAALCENIMEPIYDLLGPCQGMGSNATWHINSGLRNETSGSDHNKGRACDFQLDPKASITTMYELCVQLEKILPYNQLIFEYRNKGTSNWIHVSYSTEGNQKKAFTMVDDRVVNSSGNSTPGSTGLYKFFTKD